MHDDKQIPPCNSYEEMAEFWDTHSLADYWDQTEPADFEIALEARRRYLVAVDREVLARVQRLAQLRGVSSESLVNLLLEQRLREVESQAAKAELTCAIALSQPLTTWFSMLSQVVAQTLAQTWRKCSDNLVIQSIPFPMRGAAGKQNALAHRLLQISLERAPWHIRRDCLE